MSRTNQNDYTPRSQFEVNSKTRRSRSQISDDDYSQYDDRNRQYKRSQTDQFNNQLPVNNNPNPTNPNVYLPVVPVNNNISAFSSNLNPAPVAAPLPINNTNDAYAIVPRTGPKTKTIIIRDEKGNEISRIISSKKDQLPLELIKNAQQQNQLVQQPVQQNPVLLQTQQYYVPSAVTPVAPVTPLPLLVQQTPTLLAAPLGLDTNRSNGTIPEERRRGSSRKRSSRKTSAHRLTLEKARSARTARLNQEKIMRSGRIGYDDYDSSFTEGRTPSPIISQLKPVDPKNHIFCCAFCEKANTTTCAYCWRLCGFPVWFATVIGVAMLLIIIALAIIVALYGAQVIPQSG